MKREDHSLDGYLVGREKRTRRFIALIPELREELQRFRKCIIARLGERSFAIYAHETHGGKMLMLCVECAPEKQAVLRFADIVRECEPIVNAGRPVTLIVQACVDVKRRLKELTDEV